LAKLPHAKFRRQRQADHGAMNEESSADFPTGGFF
jgi:hypothetical protein